MAKILPAWFEACLLEIFHAYVSPFYNIMHERVRRCIARYLQFSPLSHAKKFRKYLSPKHLKLNFSLEKENVCFLVINIFLEKGIFVTNVYQKKTFSGVHSNPNSFIPETYKTGLIKPLLFPYFSLCSDFMKFHHEINILKSILYKNSYPHDFVDKYIIEFFDSVSMPNIFVSTVPKKNLMASRGCRAWRRYILCCYMYVCIRLKSCGINWDLFSKSSPPLFHPHISVG